MEGMIDVITQQMENVRDPNKVVMARIRKFQPGTLGRHAQEYMMGKIQEFAVRYELDERCLRELQSLSPSGQVFVLDQNMDGVRNPSGVISSRCKKVATRPQFTPTQLVHEAFHAAPSMSRVRLPHQDPAPQGVDAPNARTHLQAIAENFIIDHSLDQRSALALQALPPLAMLDVVLQPMTDVRNANAVVSTRCEKHAGAPQPLGPRCVQWISEIVDVFCTHYGIQMDSDCYSNLRSLPAEHQFAVVSDNMHGVRNPQGIVWSRVQKALRGEPLGDLHTGPPRAVPFPIGGMVAPMASPPEGLFDSRFGMDMRSDPVEDWIRSYGIDARAADSLKVLSREEQQELMSYPPPEQASGYVLGWIAGRRGAGGRRAPTFQPAPQQQPTQAYTTGDPVEDFIAINRLDDKCADALRTASHHEQHAVLAGESLQTARNPSAVVMQRLREARGEGTRSGKRSTPY